MFCASCGSPLVEGARFCALCRQPVATAALEMSQQATRLAPDLMTAAAGAGRTPQEGAAASRNTPSSGWLSSSGSIDHGRFEPGVLLDHRYRIVELLGTGGMGEVFRADDLRLGQTVALKFLPARLRDDPVHLAQFHSEVRTARQISHPNICRVYDVGEADGHLYLSMEYVGGENLASSLRRLGRVPEDKAVEIARQLCAGLAAAHDRGVLHRDLKPANIMLDGAGNVRLMDFGLAAVGRVENVRAGTPAYMAPEQLLGREVTARSDIFALGLVLYELFTGRRAFTAGTIQELVELHQSAAITPPSSIVTGLNGAIEAAILRCLDPDPARRPSSARAVAAALPGGDPLAAALAAGETPSPEMVAAAGAGAGLSRRAAIGVYVGVLAGIGAFAALTIPSSALDTMRPEFPPEVMAQKARDALGQIGYAGRPRDQAFGYQWNSSLLEHVQQNEGPTPDLRAALTGFPPPLQFWYRQSPAPMTGGTFKSDLLIPGIVDEEDPAPVVGGMVQMRLDHRGRLLFFEAIPPQVQETAPSPAATDWAPLFRLAGIDEAALEPASPQWHWLAAADTRQAWTGRWPGSTRALRVEAASLGGKPVAFMLAGPWQQPWRSADAGDDDTLQLLFLLIVICALLLGALLLAQRNLRDGRGDRRGALRLAVLTTCSMLALWTLAVHPAASIGLLGTFVVAICTAIFNGALLWTIYIALEPVVRRRWPQALVSWSTLFGGRVRDPVVGRDVLLGVALGVVWVLILAVVDAATRDLDRSPFGVVVEALGGMRSTLALLVEGAFGAIRSALIFFLLLFMWRVLLRRQWAAAVAFAATFAALDLLGPDRPVIIATTSFVVLLTVAFVVVRWGLVSLTVSVLVTNLLLSAPLSRDLAAWYIPSAALFVGVAVALATWALYVLLAARPSYAVPG